MAVFAWDEVVPISINLLGQSGAGVNNLLKSGSVPCVNRLAERVGGYTLLRAGHGLCEGWWQVSPPAHLM